MSVENVNAFFDKVEEDKGLQEKIKALAEKDKGHKEELASDMVKMAADAGIEFTAADLAEARKSTVEELPEDELKEVAGGMVGYTCTGTVMKDLCKYVTWS